MWVKDELCPFFFFLHPTAVRMYRKLHKIINVHDNKYYTTTYDFYFSVSKMFPVE